MTVDELSEFRREAATWEDFVADHPDPELEQAWRELERAAVSASPG